MVNAGLRYKMHRSLMARHCNIAFLYYPIAICHTAADFNPTRAIPHNVQHHLFKRRKIKTATMSP